MTDQTLLPTKSPLKSLKRKSYFNRTSVNLRAKKIKLNPPTKEDLSRLKAHIKNIVKEKRERNDLTALKTTNGKVSLAYLKRLIPRELCSKFTNEFIRDLVIEEM